MSEVWPEDLGDKRGKAQLTRRSVVVQLLAERADLLLVTGLGSPSYDAMAVGDHPKNFYLWAAMGGAAMVGLGLALARPGEPVAVLTGDGEQLMGSGALATIAAARPSNFSLLVLDNRHYGETGMQPSHTAWGCDLVGMAEAAGFAWSLSVTGQTEIADLQARLRAGEGPGFASILVTTDDVPRVSAPARWGRYQKPLPSRLRVRGYMTEKTKNKKAKNKSDSSRQPDAPRRWVGQSLPRKEDEALLTGCGRFHG